MGKGYLIFTGVYKFKFELNDMRHHKSGKMNKYFVALCKNIIIFSPLFIKYCLNDFKLISFTFN